MSTQYKGTGSPAGVNRRTLLKAGAAAALTAVSPVTWAKAPRTLSFYHTHTRERLHVTYARGVTHIPEALEEINHFLRDFRTDEVHPIDPRLLDVLHKLREHTAAGRGTYEIVSAFRSPRTNEMLRQRSSGVAKRSMHVEGRALDVRLTGVRTARLRDTALGLGAGGVGFYRRSDFVHVDTGRVRRW